MQLRRLGHAVPTTLALTLILFLTVAVPRLRAQDDEQAPQDEQPAVVCGSQAYLDSLPVKPPKDPTTKRQVQLVNCSDQVVLGAANAARAKDQPAWPVFPQEGTWVMQPFNPNNPTNYSNVITIDIPPQWYGQHVGGNTGNFWVRTGCRYDITANRAECETGGCSSQYDCSAGNISPTSLTTIVEWTFYQHFDNTPPDLFIDSPDISAVNGASLTVDVSPKGGSPTDPVNKNDWHWLNWNYPLTVHGADLREPGNCQISSTNTAKLFRSDIDKTKGPRENYPLFGYVIVDGNGAPAMPTGNNALSCQSNCARYKFPIETGQKDCDTKNDEGCYFWTTLCAGNEAIKYEKNCFTGKCPTDNPNCQDSQKYYCDTDSDCLACNGNVDYHIACFHKAGPAKRGVCELRGFYTGTVAACNGPAGLDCNKPGDNNQYQCASPTNLIACTNTYGSINPLDESDATRFDYNDQPPVGDCKDVKFRNKQAKCIGEDTLHKVLHGAYTWPNDPQVYQSDASVYRMVFSPEGRGRAPITKAQPLPACSALPPNYKFDDNRFNCRNSVDFKNAFFTIAKVRNQGGAGEIWTSTGNDWPCSIGSERSDSTEGILCYWNAPPPAKYNCLAPKTDTYVTNSACGRIDAGTSLVSGSMTPKNGDWLFVEVSVPKVLNNVTLPPPSSIRGCAGSWALLASRTVNTNQGVIAWYKGKSNTSAACKVTVTLPNSNPAELKLYDVPMANGVLDKMSSASGSFTDGPDPDVNAGIVTTTFSSDLQLGALLQVDLTPTPITYWKDWLTNGPNQLNCIDEDKNCPKDDGTDFLPGHGPYSGDSQVGHNRVVPGMQYFHRPAEAVRPGSKFAWAGLAVYVQLTQ